MSTIRSPKSVCDVGALVCFESPCRMLVALDETRFSQAGYPSASGGRRATPGQCLGSKG